MSQELVKPERSAPVWVLPAVWLIRGYQRLISPLFGPTCRFQPTCSHYALHCLCEHGLLRGTWLSVRRVARCHPFHPGGYDPPPSPRSAPLKDTPCAMPPDQ